MHLGQRIGSEISYVVDCDVIVECCASVVKGGDIGGSDAGINRTVNTSNGMTASNQRYHFGRAETHPSKHLLVGFDSLLGKGN